MIYSSSITYKVPLVVEVFSAGVTFSLLVEVGEVLHPAGLGVLGDCLDFSRPDWPGSAARDKVKVSYFHPTGSTRQKVIH